MEKQHSDHLAVLIDADNISADVVGVLLEEIAKYGTASVKRIYGDWSSSRLEKWKQALLPHAITPVQQFAYTTGKNSTDMSMVIDAMDLLYSGNFDGFCLVSSDSDFTRLASRIRANGLIVYGFGRQSTPESLRKACDKFIYTEILQQVVDDDDDRDSSQVALAPSRQNTTVSSRKTSNQLKGDCALMALIRQAINENADTEGWAGLGVVGQYMQKVNSDFDARNYGYAKLSGLIKAINLFETKSENKAFYVRIQKKKSQ